MPSLRLQKQASATLDYAWRRLLEDRFFVKLELENETGRRLSRMCCCVRTQCDQAEVGTLVNEASVFESKREVSGEVVVSAATVLEHCFRLGTRSGDEGSMSDSHDVVPSGALPPMTTICEIEGVFAAAAMPWAARSAYRMIAFASLSCSI